MVLSAGEWGEITWNRRCEQMRSCHMFGWRLVVPTFGRPTGFCPRIGPVLAEKLLGGPQGRLCMIPRCPRSVTCSSGTSIPCERARLVDAICLGLRSVFSLLLRCAFYLISLAYKYLPTLVQMIRNKPLPLYWCSHFMHLCRNRRPNFGIQQPSTMSLGEE